MLTENAQVFGMTGQTYRLGKTIGSGGEGTVFDVPGKPLVVKIYNQPKPELEKKLYYMVMHPVPSLTDQYGSPILCLAWPRDLIFLPGEGFSGYVMPKMENCIEVFEVARCCASPRAKRLFPNYTWELNVKVARNLALSVHHLHSSGYVIGDLNDKNVLVRKDGGVCILDIDSFDFSDINTGVHYKCAVGLPDYLAPELQGKHLREETARFSEATDDFALAIHIFQLLMDNYHPFTCRRLIRTQDSSTVNQRLQQIVSGICPYIHSHPGYEIPLGAPTMAEILPENLRSDFVQTLDYTAATALARASERTPARKWAEDLNALLKTCENGGLVRCARDSSHFYLREKGSCGLCAARQRYEDRRSGAAVPVRQEQAFREEVMEDPMPGSQSAEEMYQRGLRCEQAHDPAEAVQWFRKAAEANHPMAQCKLGDYISYGTVVKKDLSQMEYWYRRSAEQGCAQAQYSLGLMYKNGNVPSGDRTQAAYWLQKAAEQNHTSAHLDLGLLYESDRETEKDPAQAVYWYRRGAELGHGGCQYNLARCLWYGIGTQADHQQALLWCRRAAAAGVEVAKSVLPQWEREAGAVHSDSPAQPPPRGNPPSSPAHSEKDRVVLMLGWVCMALYGLFLIVGTVNNGFAAWWFTSEGTMSFLVMTWALFLPVLRKQCLLWKGLPTWQPKAKAWQIVYTFWLSLEAMGIAFPLVALFGSPLILFLSWKAAIPAEASAVLFIIPFGLYHILWSRWRKRAV